MLIISHLYIEVYTMHKIIIIKYRNPIWLSQSTPQWHRGLAQGRGHFREKPDAISGSEQPGKLVPQQTASGFAQDEWGGWTSLPADALPRVRARHAWQASHQTGTWLCVLPIYPPYNAARSCGTNNRALRCIKRQPYSVDRHKHVYYYYNYYIRYYYNYVLRTTCYYYYNYYYFI
jgi:hypothetical protein